MMVTDTQRNLIQSSVSALALILFVVILIIVYKYWRTTFRRNPRLVKFAATIPGPLSLPFLGNGLDFLFAGPSVLNKFMEYSRTYGSVYRLWFGKHLVVVLSEVEHLEVVFRSSKTLGKPEIFEPFRDWFGEGMSTTGSTYIWKKTRKLQESSFKKSVLPYFVPTFNEKIYNGIEKMKKLVDGPEFDVSNYVSPVAFEIIAKIALDIEVDARDERALKFNECIQTAFETSILRMFRPWLHVKPICDLVFGRQMTNVRGMMWQYIEQMIASKADKLKEIIPQEDPKNISDSLSIPRMLLAAYHSQSVTGSKTKVREEIMTILTGGTGTIATAVSFCLLALAANSDIQDRLYDEIRDVFGNTDEPACVDDVSRLPYLDQVLKETLRRYPPGPGIFRNVEEDINIGSHLVPAGTALMLSVVGVHTNPKYYPSPEKFNPDHFSAEAVANRPALSYLPFGAGPRSCIAMNFGYLEMKLMLIAFVRTFSFHTTVKLEDLKLLMTLGLSSINGYNLQIRLRPCVGNAGLSS